MKTKICGKQLQPIRGLSSTVKTHTQTSLKMLTGKLLLTGIVGVGLLLNVRLTAQTFTVLYSFTRGSDGSDPNAGLALVENALYGTTALGGTSNPIAAQKQFYRLSQ